MNEMFVYYGQNINDDTARLMKEILPHELKKFHAGLTLSEVAIGVRMAMRGIFGETTYKKVSIKLFNELIDKYFTSDIRKRIIAAYQTCKEEIRVETNFLTDEQKEQFVMNGLNKEFDKYCNEGAKATMLHAIHYDFLIRIGISMPDFTPFIKEAAAAFDDKGKNETTITETMSRMFRNNIRGEAKRLALVSVFESLKQQGKSFKDYISLQNEQRAA